MCKFVHFLRGLLLSTTLLSAVADVLITQQPVNQEVFIGQTASFSVQAVGTSGDLVLFQWYRNGNAVAGATNATLTIPNVQLPNLGTYYVKAGNLQTLKESVHAALTALEGVTSQAFPAVEVLFPTDAGHTYLIQSSTDLVNWTTGSEQITATGPFISRLFSSRSGVRTFYRVVQRVELGALGLLNGRTLYFSPNLAAPFQTPGPFQILFSGAPGAQSGTYAASGAVIDNNSYTYSLNGVVGSLVLPGASYQLDFSTFTYTKSQLSRVVETGSFSY